jgi:phosphoglycerol transferase MdoB-like AlkP superfamily enzyme
MEEIIFAYDNDPIWNVLFRLLVNLIVQFILIWLVYHKYAGNKIYLFSFFQMGMMIFMLCSLLKTVDIQFGVALSLFAIFGILRFRTENMPVKTMSYLFSIVGTSAINAMANFPKPVRGFILFNIIILLFTFLLEVFLKGKDINKHRLTYKRLELLNEDKKQELLDDISSTIGRRINQVHIRNIDIPKGQADLEVFFSEDEPF